MSSFDTETDRGEKASRVSERPATRVVMDAAAIERATTRLAHEIVERNPGLAELALVAIISGGVPIADRLAQELKRIDGPKVFSGALDVTLYRDDVMGHGRRPIPQPTRMPFLVGGRRVVLVEDVVFTGRTVRAALDAVLDFGRPESIQVATLVDRGHRELPIRVDFVGKNVPTSRDERVELQVNGPEDWRVVVV